MGQRVLDEFLDSHINGFVLSPEDAVSAGYLIPRYLIQSLVRWAIPRTRAIISGSPLVAIGCGSSGRIFIGVNVELPDLPLHHSIHAEQFLVTNLILNSERKLETLAISDTGSSFRAPCSHCCEFLIQEIRNSREIQVVITEPIAQNETYMPLGSFLPQTSSPYNAVPDLLQPRNNGLTVTFMDPNSAREICQDSSHCPHIMCRALAAANRSYAPYTNYPSGVALRDRNNNVYSGCYIESVANNSSVGPVQAALVDFVANGGGRDFKTIVEAVMVRKPLDFRQEDSARMIIQKIAHPNCVFSVLDCY